MTRSGYWHAVITIKMAAAPLREEKNFQRLDLHSYHFDPPSTMARLQKLPEFFQADTLNFLEFLLKKVIDDACRDEDRQWFHFSLESALKDMEDEPLVYSEADLKERFQ